MRNLKRALSLVVASVMLLGMMVVGTSAASFADADEIVNKEAVEITAGLGLFAGSDGKFNPKGNVTRAQMATIIVKMLYGSEINADQFKGTNKFNDTAAFEGGWAEGYINLCANLGIVKGFGDGSFKPGQSLTTAEAVTMIINALKVDAGAGTWPLTVMAKAEEMKLFAELAVKPGTNEALTRDALASVVLEGLQYSPKGTTGYKVDGLNFVFDNVADALQAAQYDATKITEVVGDDTLANTVFDMISVKGFITENQATGLECTKITVPGVEEDVEVLVNLETGLDMIGHYVTAYYAEEYESEDETGIAYAIVDEAKYVVVNEEDGGFSDEKKAFVAAFGTKKIPTAAAVYTVDGDYVVTVEDGIEGYDKDLYNANNGTYVIYENAIIGFVAGASKTLSYVVRVNTTAGKESILVAGFSVMQNNADEDVVNAYEGIAKDDIVVVTKAGAGEDTVYTLTKAEKVEGKITRTTPATDDKAATITVNGVQYEQNLASNNTLLDTDITGISWEETYAVYVADGKFIGWDGIASAANLADVVYVVGTYTVDGAADAYGKVTQNTYAQGVDMNGKEVSFLISTFEDKDEPAEDVLLGNPSIEAGFYTFKLSTVSSAEKKANIMTASEVTDDTEESVYTAALEANNEIDSKTAYVGIDGDIAFLESTTKFIVVDDSTIEGELDIAIMTGSYSGDVSERPVIVSKDADGNMTLEVVVIYDTVSFKADDYIYVTEDQAANVSTGANGDQYTVYFMNEAANKEIVVDNDSLEAGFYEYSFETVDGVVVYTLDPATDAEGDFILADEIFTRLSGTKLISTNIKALDAANAKIVDARTAETLKSADISAIEALEDIAAAKAAGYDVTFTAMLDEDLEDATAVTLIIVTAVEEIPEEV